MDKNGLPEKPWEHFFYCVQWLETQARINCQCAINYPHEATEYKIRDKAFQEAANLVAERYRKAYGVDVPFSKEARALHLLFQAKYPEGLTASDIAQIDKEWLKAPIDELEDKDVIKGTYETTKEGTFVYTYRLRRSPISH